MILDLIVTTPFGDYNRGDMISDADVIEAVLSSRPDCVVQIPWISGEPTPYVLPQDGP